MKRVKAAHPGYIFLVTVLVIGVIASATATSLLLLGWAAEQNGLLLMQSAQAYENAQACAEQALRELRTDLSYAGDTSVALDNGTCEILAIGGTGNESRNICVAGYSGDSTHRVQISIDQVYPSVIVNGWEEVTSFTVCP